MSDIRPRRIVHLLPEVLFHHYLRHRAYIKKAFFSYDNGIGNIPEGKRMSVLFPVGIPDSRRTNSMYIKRTEVPVINENGQEDTLVLGCHFMLSSELYSIFYEMKEAGFAVKKSETGCYNFRKIKGKNILSNHAFGVAVDINWEDNFPETFSPSKNPYSVTEEIVNIWKKHGFFWGGDWKGKSFDPMHFSFAERRNGGNNYDK